jgi:hypothetical protein
LAAIVIGAAACTGGTSSAPSGGGSAAGSSVSVTLQEWAVVPNVTSTAAGSVAFDVTNAGPEDPHELVVFKTDLPHRGLPTKEDGSVDEAGEGVELIGEIEEFPVGETQSATFDLTPGKYVFICNIYDADEQEAHYQEGMSIEFTVS